VGRTDSFRVRRGTNQEEGNPKEVKSQIGRKFPYLIALALFLLILALRLPSVNQPFGRDQGIFACIGQKIVSGITGPRAG
jgi:hypothetical protein